MLPVLLGVVCLVWYLAVFIISVTGYVQLLRYYTRQRRQAVIESRPLAQVPHVTVIRPVKGLEPNLYECLAATFQQTYPSQKLSIRLCISNKQDPGYEVLQRVIADFPGFDAQILVEDEDPLLQSPALHRLGPNPKIRNMSRAYREAKGDIIWVADCNVWMGRGVAGRLIDLLCGFSNDGPRTPYKVCHQVPLVVDVTGSADGDGELESLNTIGLTAASTSTAHYEMGSQLPKAGGSLTDKLWNRAGGQLEEMFLSSAHAKMYTGINTVLLAPCMVGKSAIFRKSHLDSLTDPNSSEDGVGPGIDYFSYNICEDHLIGDLLWKRKVPEEDLAARSGPAFGKHALLFGDLAIQPMAQMSLHEYIARRVRWLRVRKFTVTLATLVEPGTECFLCCFYGALAFTSLPFFYKTFGVTPSWTAVLIIWFLNVLVWMLADRFLYTTLHSMNSIEMDDNTPSFVKLGKRQQLQKQRVRPFKTWLFAWLGRELLAFPIWFWAVFGGVTVLWRGQKFKVGMDMRVTAIDDGLRHETRRMGSRNGSPGSKARVE